MRNEPNRSELARVTSIVVALVVVLAPTVYAQRAIDRAGDRGLPPSVADFARPDRQPLSRAAALNFQTARVLNDAIAAVNERQYGDARAAIDRLRLGRLTPYERGKAEQVLFTIAFAEEKYGEARQHLLNAIESGGLPKQEIDAAQNEVKRIEARLATAPPA